MTLPVNLKNLEGLLKLKEGQRLIKFATSPLLSTGENYGSTMLAVDVIISENEKETKHHYVAKMIPPSELLREWFNTPVTFKKEMALYTIIIPTLQQFQREQGVQSVMDFFPKVEGARISLDSQLDEVDQDAAILFHNLKYQGYVSGDRFKGFDLDSARLILKNLAIFHAVPIAFKRQKPQEFQEKILPHLTWYYEFKLNENVDKEVLEVIVKLAEKDEESKQYTDKIKRGYAFGRSCFKSRPPLKELFATITHNDFWVNNTMLKFDDDDKRKPVHNAMVDFQIIEYSSPGHDVLFFLYSSVSPGVLRENYDDFIKLYYETFVETLRGLKCDPSPFTFELFQEELEDSARHLQFYHIMIMLAPIFTKKGAAKELGEIKREEFMQANTETSEEYPEKVLTVVRDFGKRGWI